MRQTYTKMEELAPTIMERKQQGETNREIGDSLGLTKKQIKQLVTRQNKKAKLLAAGYVLRPKGRPRQDEVDEETKRNNELIQLRMTVELLRNFLSEAGRR